MNEVRPMCRFCSRRLQSVTVGAETIEEFMLRRRQSKTPIRWKTKPTGLYGYDGNGLFCTLRCGYEFGLAVAKARDGK